MKLATSLITAMVVALCAGCAGVQSPPDTKIIPAGYSGPKGVPSQGLNKAAYHASLSASSAFSPSTCMSCHWSDGGTSGSLDKGGVSPIGQPGTGTR